MISKIEALIPFAKLFKSMKRWNILICRQILFKMLVVCRLPWPCRLDLPHCGLQAYTGRSILHSRPSVWRIVNLEPSRWLVSPRCWNPTSPWRPWISLTTKTTPRLFLRLSRMMFLVILAVCSSWMIRWVLWRWPKWGSRIGWAFYLKREGRLMCRSSWTFSKSRLEKTLAWRISISAGISLSFRVFGWSCRNRIGQDGGRLIFSALEENDTIQKLILSHCSIQDAGAKAFAEALCKNQTLREWDLSSSLIPSNQCRVHLDHNGISDKGLCYIADALKKNDTLQTLRLWGNDFKVAACEVL